MIKKNKSTIDITKKILKKIKKNKVKMRPHVYFVIGSFLFGIGVASTILFSTFLVNIISFKLRIQNQFDYFHFGRNGFLAFLRHFPWLLLGLAIVGIIGGVLLIKKLDISYKKNFSGIIASLIGLTLIFGIAIDRMGLNDQTSRFKPFKPFYKSDTIKDQIIRGRVLNSGSSTIEIIRPNGKRFVIDIPDDIIKKRQFMIKNDDVSIFGSWQGAHFIIEDFSPKRFLR